MTSERFQPPYPPYDPTDPQGFSYETVVKRWPIIITSLIDHIHNVNHNFIMHNPDQDGGANPKVVEGTQIIQQASKLKYEMARDKTMLPISDDGGPNLDCFNTELEKLTSEGKDTWFKAPWLFAECYLYRLMRSWFANTTLWKDFDPFMSQKEGSFRSSAKAVYSLAHTMEELIAEREMIAQDEAKLAVLWDEMIQMCLWGNATDLSLLTNMTEADINSLQTVGKEAQEKRRDFILRNDSEAARLAVMRRKGRVDIVLDNSGFEFYTDLLFADFLISVTPWVTNVVFHPKTIPWFVSDVTPPDVSSLFSSLRNHEAFFGESYGPSEAEGTSMLAVVSRWERYFADGAFALSVPRDSGIGAKITKADYWTMPMAYWDMAIDAPELHSELRECSLVVFKGDLNFRKLTGDIKWPVETPFERALGHLAGSIPILSLRTNKADVVVGLKEGQGAAVKGKDPKWRVNGRFALISYAPKQ